MSRKEAGAFIPTRSERKGSGAGESRGPGASGTGSQGRQDLERLQGFRKRVWDRRRHQPFWSEAHAADLLKTRRGRDELRLGDLEIDEIQPDLVLTQMRERHPQFDGVECVQLLKIVAGEAKRHQPQVARQLLENLGGTLSQEHLAAAALPGNVPGEINIPDDIGLL